jgi:putative ATPase
MKSEGYGEGYRYAHEFGGFVPGETYLPDEIAGERFYEASREGYELTIHERLARWRGKGKPRDE